MSFNLATIPNVIGSCAATFEVGDRAPDHAITRTAPVAATSAAAAGCLARQATPEAAGVKVYQTESIPWEAPQVITGSVAKVVVAGTTSSTTPE